jgi:hypothetical protein
VADGAAVTALCLLSRRPIDELGSVIPNSPKFAPSPTVAAKAVTLSALAVASSFRRCTRKLLSQDGPRLSPGTHER